MPTLVELATQIVTAQASTSALSTDYIISALTRVHSTLEQLETGVRPRIVDEEMAVPRPSPTEAYTALASPSPKVIPVAAQDPGQKDASPQAPPPAPEDASQAAPAPNLKEAFKEHEVVCLICGKGYKVLGTHLRRVHNLSPRDYRKQFSIPATQPLLSTSAHDRRKELGPPVRKTPGKKPLAQDTKVEVLQTVTPVPAPAKKKGRPPKTAAVLPA